MLTIRKKTKTKIREHTQIAGGIKIYAITTYLMLIAVLAYVSLNEQQYLQTKISHLGLLFFAIQEVLFRHFLKQQTAKMEQQWYKERGRGHCKQNKNKSRIFQN